MAEEMKKSNASSILANDTAPKSAKTMGGGVEKKTPAAGAAPKQEHHAAAGGEKKKHKHTHIEHHYDENGKPQGHTTRHTPLDGGQDVSYASQDLDGVHDGLEHHVGEPNGDEGQQSADAGAQPGGQPDAAAGGAPQATPQPGAGAPPQAV
jgi:hypothetical protein